MSFIFSLPPVAGGSDSHDTSNHFDELAILQLIPRIIEQLRHDQVTPADRITLEQIFGDLWPLITDEAVRKSDEEPMNALLKPLLMSNEVRLAKRDIVRSLTNDFYSNDVQRVYQPAARSKMRIMFDDPSLSPAERVLKMAAAVIHKYEVQRVARRTKQRPRSPKLQQMSRQAFQDLVPSAMRVKREHGIRSKIMQLIEDIREALDEQRKQQQRQDSRREKRFSVVQETEKPTLKFMMALVNELNQSEEDDEEGFASEYSIKSSFPISDYDGFDYFGDYAFDQGVPDDYEDDVEYANVGQPSKFFEPLEEPSFNELIKLAAVHRLRRANELDQDKIVFPDDYEDYEDDEPMTDSTETVEESETTTPNTAS
jgi:hypothetical protein